MKVLTPDISFESPQSSERSLYRPSLYLSHNLIPSLALALPSRLNLAVAVRKTLRSTRRARFSQRLQALVFVSLQGLPRSSGIHTRSGVKTLTQFQTPTRSRLRLSSVAICQVGGCTLAPIIQCLQDVVVVGAVKRGPGAVMGTCPRLVPRLAPVLIQSDHLDVGGSQERVEVAVVYQARLAETQTMTNSSHLVWGTLGLLEEITRLS